MSKNTDLGSLVNYIKGQVTGRLNAPAYTSATAFTGTIAGYLGFDTSGNILTTAGVGFTGSGTTNYVAKFTGSTALGNSLIFDNGSSIGINTTSPSSLLSIQRGASNDNLELIGSGASGYSDILFYNTNKVARLGYIDWSDTLVRWNIEANLPFTLYTNAIERMRITADGGLNINTSTTGYTLNAIASTSTQFNAVYKGSGYQVQIMSRFISDTSANKGIAIGYATLGFSTTSGIWATQAGSFQLGVLDGTTYKSKINMNTTTIAIDIPSSPTGLASGQLYNDGNYVRIV